MTAGAMFVAACHLVWAALNAAAAHMSATLWSLSVGLIVFIVWEIVRYRAYGLTVMRARWKRESLWGLLILGSAWGLTFFVSIAEIIYGDHIVFRNLAISRLEELQGKDGKGGLRAQALTNLAEIDRLHNEVEGLKDQLAEAQSTKPKEVVRYLPPPPITIVNGQQQRSLTDYQREKLTEGLSPLKDRLQGLMMFSEGGESSRYLLEFIALFRKIGIKTIGPEMSAPGDETQRGVMVGFHDLAHPSELGLQFVKVIREAGIEVREIKTDVSSPQGFDLFICNN